MNNYPSWWNQTITIFNRYDDPATHKVSWYKTTIPNCFWHYVGQKLTVGDTTLDTDSTVCRIPKQKNFIEKYLWAELSEAEKSQQFTVGAGDIIIYGIVSDDIDEYTSGKRSSDIMTKYKKLQGCILVTTVAINVDGGRGNEHYRIRGV